MKDLDAAAIEFRARELEIGRLLHFTPTRNFLHVAVNGDGLLSTKHMLDSERQLFTQQDLLRLDGYPDHISCSIEFPNALYFERKLGDAQGAAKLFGDWVVLELPVTLLWHPRTLFCACNAATRSGALIGSGAQAFESVYAQEVVGAQNKLFRRSALRQRPVPTHDQAEVLVHRQIPADMLRTVYVRHAEQAAREQSRLDLLGIPRGRYTFVIAPSFFAAWELVGLLRNGQRPIETPWEPMPLDD